MANYGLLVVDWPLVLGCDASGVVVESGETAKSKYGFNVGDHVCGCTRLGSKGYSTAQEFYLMDAAVTIPKPKNLSLIQAATLGVGAQTACLGLFDGLGLELPSTKSSDKDEWVIIMGGASNVGKSAVQLGRAAGYKVLASCSSKSAKLVESLGASTFDYKSSEDEQLKRIMQTTSGRIAGCFDAAAANDPVVVKQLFKELGISGSKKFSTTNDWTGISDFEGGKTHVIQLGPIGRPDATALNGVLASYTPVIVSLVEAGKLQTAEYEVIGDGGFEDAVKAYAHQASGAGGSRKVVVKIGDE